MRTNPPTALWFFCIAFCVMTDVVFARPIQEEFFAFKRVLEVKQDGISFVEIPDDMYSGAKEALVDVRLMDENNRERVYKKWDATKTFVVNREALMILNPNTNHPNFEVLLKNQTQEPVLNQLNMLFEYSGDYLLSVRLFGSNDGIEFKPIKVQGYLYHLSSKEGGQNGTLYFSPIEYTYIKAMFTNKVGNVKAENLVEAYAYEEKNVVKENTEKNVKDTILDITQVETQTVIKIDLNNRLLPVTRVRFNIQDEFYNRNVAYSFSKKSANTSQSRKASSNPAQGTLYRDNIQGAIIEKNAIELPTPTYASEMILSIENKDNAALNIEGVEVFYRPQYLAFEAKKGEQLNLLYGNKTLAEPVYDLNRKFDVANQDEWGKISLGNEMPNPSFNKKNLPLLEQYPYLSTIVIIFTAAVLIMIVIKSFKKTVS